MSKVKIRFIYLFIFFLLPLHSFSQIDSLSYDDDFLLDEIIVKTKGIKKINYEADNRELISASELTRAACCNLGESFSTNPSVDVNYSDGATGTKQIKLLGLSGTYVQMMLENIPNFRGVSAPYALDYIPGPWIQSIQISKGASSVKNGFESITGQINVELKKPQAEKALNLNAYFDSDGRLELNGTGNLHLGKKWSGALLLHGTNSFWSHDGNDDGFIDMPKIRRLSLVNRWAYLGENYVFQISGKGLIEKRESGQLGKHSSHLSHPYLIDIFSKRLELFTKNAYILDKETNSNIALVLSGNVQDLNTSFGNRWYDALQYDAFGALMYEREWGEKHSISAGVNYQYDHYRQHYLLSMLPDALKQGDNNHESVTGIYGQYTFNHYDKIILMGGLRYDYSSLYGSFVTPRFHVRYNPTENWSFHGSAGMGRRSPHPLAEYYYLLASSRNIMLPENLKMEVATNTGVGFTWNPQLWEKEISLSAEYYYTHFYHEMTADLNEEHKVLLSTDSKGYSHSVQVEFCIDPIEDMTVSASYRYNNVKVDYGKGYVVKPLTSTHKGLFSVGYRPFMGKWQFDATLVVNGGGKMPTPYLMENGEMSWNKTYPTFCNLNFQITRSFRHWSVYLGCENITNYRQKNPIISASDPWSKNFDATMIWGPIQGAMAYVGVRINL